MASKNYAKADKSRCVACGACITACPRGAVSIWKGCYAKMEEDLCVGCGICAKTCPAGCITITAREEAKHEG